MILFKGLFTLTLPINSFEAIDILWVGSTSKLSLSTVGYKLVAFCLNLRLLNPWFVVGDILPIKHVK